MSRSRSKDSGRAGTYGMKSITKSEPTRVALVGGAGASGVLRGTLLAMVASPADRSEVALAHPSVPEAHHSPLLAPVMVSCRLKVEMGW